MPDATTPQEVAARVVAWARQGRAGLLFDYDGTLVDVRPTPAQAVIDDEARRQLLALARRPSLKVGILTGRSRAGLTHVAGRLEGITLAVNGGLHLVEGTSEWIEPRAARFRLVLANVVDQIAAIAARWPGTLIEDKQLSLAVHYRQAPAARRDLEQALLELQSHYADRLRVVQGKEVFEVQPAIDWDKGRAAGVLLDRWEVGSRALFVGDDQIDEPAFEEVRRRGGITCRVAEVGQPRSSTETSAEWILADPEEARTLLRLLVEQLPVEQLPDQSP